MGRVKGSGMALILSGCSLRFALALFRQDLEEYRDPAVQGTTNVIEQAAKFDCE